MCRCAACADLGVELCGQTLTWDDVRPFKLQFRMLDMSRTGKVSPADLEAYNLKMQAAKRRLSRVREVVDTVGRTSFSAPRTPNRSVTGEAAHYDMGMAAAKMQALIRGRKARSRRIAPMCSTMDAMTEPAGVS